MRRVPVPEKGAETLFGTQDENLRYLEGALKVRIKGQGSELLVEGAENGEQTVGQIFEQLTDLMKEGYSVTAGDVRLAADLPHPVDGRYAAGRGGFPTEDQPTFPP